MLLQLSLAVVAGQERKQEQTSQRNFQSPVHVSLSVAGNGLQALGGRSSAAFFT